MLRSVDLKDYMLKDPATVKADDSIYEAIHKILMYKVSGICVVGNANVLVGVLSEMDCLKAILSSVYNDSSVDGSVSEYMTTDVISVKMNDNIVDIASDMLEHSHRRRPVIDEEGTLVGQVSCRRLLLAVKEFTGSIDSREH